MRIVSLLPSATEIVFALGLGDDLVGRTHECDYPPEVSSVPIVTRNAGGRGDDPSRAIHERVTAALAGGAEIYHLDREALAAVRPELILSQELCEVCAVSTQEVARAVRELGGDVMVVSLEPTSVEGILNTISTVGAFAEAEDEAVGLLELLRERLGSIENRVLERRLMGIAPRRAVVLEWLDPPFAAGHWVPEMVRRAGGWELLGREGERSAQTTWDRVRDVDPEQIVLAPCGFDAERAARELTRSALPDWFDELRAVQEGELFAVDGSGLFSRPGPRVIDGIALLAELFDPEGFAGAAPPGSWVPLGPVGVRA
jgi:iron complex transport system substrate-binding protein